MTRAWAAATLFTLAASGLAQAQSAAVDVTQSAGASSESITAAATQVRASGEPTRGLRLSAEVSWGTRSGDGSDVFGTAYPYGGRLDVIETWAEYTPRRSFGLRAVRAGRYRTPFGMAAASDHAYLGFLRPPLIRYGGYYALSSGYLEHGLDVVVGAPRLSLEASVGRPADVGTAVRRPGVTTVARAQAVAGRLVVGASAIDTTPYLPVTFAGGRTRFAGVDARWMAGGVLIRGEWLGGRPFAGTITTGGHLDAVVHTRAMGVVTVLARAEQLDYDTPTRFALETHRYSAAVRVRAWRGLSVSAGLARQSGQLTQRQRTAVEIGATFALRRDYRFGQP
ncbi:MAG: hypothetical protein IT181_24310 [Acidobacteria bacterium]|nr:hypothetical protein [Acidobacteriota bacterium]